MSELPDATSVFDDSLTGALLALAAHEELVERGRPQDDGYFDGIRRRPVPDWLRQQVLERVVLTPRVLTYRHLPSDLLRGKLVEEDILQHIPAPSTELASLNGFPASIIAAMIDASGDPIPEVEFGPRVHEFRTAYERATRYFESTGRQMPSSIQLAVDAAFPFSENYRRFSPEDTQVASDAYEAYGRAKPILDCFDEYLSLVVTAQTQNVWLGVPAVPAANDTLPALHAQPAVAPAADAVALYRIVATGLGNLPTPQTLTEALALARNPAMNDLRQLLPFWLDELPNQNGERTQRVQQEIAKANAALNRAAAGGRVSDFTTWVGLPLGLWGYSNPDAAFLTFLGLTMSAIGVGALAGATALKHQFRWATVGNTPRAQ